MQNNFAHPHRLATLHRRHPSRLDTAAVAAFGGIRQTSSSAEVSPAHGALAAHCSRQLPKQVLHVPVQGLDGAQQGLELG